MGNEEVKIDLSKMCDYCFESLSLDEDWFGFNVTDVNEVVRLFKGHKNCVNLMADKLIGIYGDKLKDSSERMDSDNLSQ